MRPGVGAVDLVDDHDRLQPALQGLGEHETRLRHRAFGGIDQHQGPVGHAQHALHLAAEVGVAGRVDDVDLHAAVGDGDVLGQDGDAALAFQVVGVEDLLADQLGFPERPLWRNRQSTSVVLPWSTWAMMAILRISSRIMVGKR